MNTPLNGTDQGVRPGSGAVVEFRDVTKRYPAGSGSKASPGAVNNLSLTIPAGEICVLVGPSGCGKTTSLKMVNRLVEPTSGQVLIDGQDVATIPATALRRQIGYVIQQIGLFPHRTIAQNIATVPGLLGWKNDRIRERVDELLVLIGLEPARVRNRYPAELSGGERQRVGVARAMAADPPVMLMDEPFGAVDPIARERLQNEFLRLHRQIGATVIFVTHDIDEAIKMGDRVAVMQQGGHLAQYAPPADLLTRPENEFVARFVGSDRGLKRLALLTVAGVDLDEAPTVREGQTLAAASLGSSLPDYCLVLDADNRPVGWVNMKRVSPHLPITPEMADASSPFLRKGTTLRDALSMMLGSAVQTGVVIDDSGRYEGALTFDSLAAILRADRVRAGLPAGDSLVREPVQGPTGSETGAP